jgi:hypothetical protein
MNVGCPPEGSVAADRPNVAMQPIPANGCCDGPPHPRRLIGLPSSLTQRSANMYPLAARRHSAPCLCGWPFTCRANIVLLTRPNEARWQALWTWRWPLPAAWRHYGQVRRASCSRRRWPSSAASTSRRPGAASADLDRVTLHDSGYAQILARARRIVRRSRAV